jgi:NAD(P)-dependent dehydrogenase (short-subunit alcohol dehydrogenase family)
VAKEYGRRDIACNLLSIEPGDGRAAWPSAGGHAAIAPVNPADAVAQAVLFLASREASYVNSEVLHVAGQGLL